MEDALRSTGQSNGNQRILNLLMKNLTFVSTMLSLRLVTSRRMREGREVLHEGFRRHLLEGTVTSLGMLHWRFQIPPSTSAEATIGMLRALMRLQLKTTLVLYWALQKDARIAWPRSRHRQIPLLPSCLTICKCHRDGVPSLKLQQLCCVTRGWRGRRERTRRHH